MKTVNRPRLLTWACLLALVALGLIVWSVFDPRPIPVVLAMSLAQALGTLSFLAFLVVVAYDLRRTDAAEVVEPGPQGKSGGD